MKGLLFVVTFFISSTIFAAVNSVKIPMHLVTTNGHDESVGYVVAKNSPEGLMLYPHLHGLPPGVHGFHVHTYPSCKDHGMAAKGHLDPKHTGKHLGPYNTKGHLGDLPVLVVSKNGTSSLPLLAPKLTVNDIVGHTLMIHADGDNYSDKPAINGGGGERLACGVITLPKADK